jgi:hypothetical protein
LNFLNYHAVRFTVMTSVASPSSVGSSDTLFSGQGSWLGDTLTAIKNSQANQGGLLGMLQSAGGDGSISSFLGKFSASANNLALISQNSVTNASSLIAQIASQNLQAKSDQKVAEVIKALVATQNEVKPHNTLDSFIYLADGTTIDTNNNIMTKPDGTQYDTTTGALYVDPASIVQMANGAYLDTQNNILTLADGTRIDTVTGLNLSTTA